MNLKIYLLLLILVFPYFIYSQSKEIISDQIWSDHFEVKYKGELQHGVVAGKSGYYVLVKDDFKPNKMMESASAVYSILVFDKDLNLVKRKKTSIKYKLKANYIQTEVKGFEVTDDKLLIFVYDRVKKAKKKYIYGYSYDANSLEEIEAKKIVLETSLEGLNRNFNKVGFAVSPNKSKYLLWEMNPLKKNKFELQVCAVDKNFNQQWKYTITNKELFTTGVISLHKALINDAGEAFINNLNGTKFITLHEEQWEPVSFTTSGKFTSGLHMKLNKDQIPTLIGFYNEKRNSPSEGAIQISGHRNRDGELRFKNTLTPFSQELLDSYTEKKRKQKRNHFYGRDVFKKSNGNYIVVGEKFYKEVQTKERGQIKKDIYHLRDILIMEITPEGKQEWFYRIPKKNISFNRLGNETFITHQYNDDVYVFFDGFEEVSGAFYSSKTLKLSGKKPQISVGKVNKEGALNVGSLANTSGKQKFRIVPKSNLLLSNEELLILARDKRKVELVKIIFGDMD